MHFFQEAATPAKRENVISSGSLEKVVKCFLICLLFGQTNYQGFDHNYYLSQVRVQGGGGSEVRLQRGGGGGEVRAQGGEEGGEVRVQGGEGGGEVRVQGGGGGGEVRVQEVEGGGGVPVQGGGGGDKIGTRAEKRHLVVPDKSYVSNNMEKPIENQSAPKRTWGETAAAAGVLTMVREGEAFGEVIENPSKKKKTPKQFRSQDPKVIEQGKPLTMAEKKLFKEAFTDKDKGS